MNRERSPFFAKQNTVCKNRANMLLYPLRCLSSVDSEWTNFFFSTKNSFLFIEETITLTQILQKEYGKKPVHETWRTPTIHYSLYVILPSFFHRCLRIVYSGLKNSNPFEHINNKPITLRCAFCNTHTHTKKKQKNQFCVVLKKKLKKKRRSHIIKLIE